MVTDPMTDPEAERVAKALSPAQQRALQDPEGDGTEAAWGEEPLASLGGYDAGGWHFGYTDLGLAVLAILARDTP